MSPLAVRVPATEVPEALDQAVVAIATAGALSSGAALVAAILTDRPLWLASTFVFVPGFVAFVALTVIMRRRQQTLFLARLKIGLIAGVLSIAAYDVVRWLLETLNVVSTHSFRAIPVFGYGLTNRSVSDPLAIAAGWAFHATNGIGFAIAFVFMCAGRPWWWGVVYGLVLEAFMVTLYPGWLGMSLGTEFLSVSVLGHVAYGAVLGNFARRSQ